MFCFSSQGKFTTAQQNTFSSRNYKYAVDLYTPTNQGGQYIPTPADDYGDSGFLTTNSEGTNFMPGSYFRTKTATTGMPNTGYEGLFQDATTNITKYYYQQPMLAAGTIKNLDCTIDSSDPVYHQNLIYPMGADSAGQYEDIQYLKNKFLDKNCMDFTVGALGISTNP
jgi:hypothetical protein